VESTGRAPGDALISSASPSIAADDARSPSGGDNAAEAPEVTISLKVRQPPLLCVVAEEEKPAQSVWRQEAEAMVDLGSMLRRKALSLPSGSSLRDQLLDEAEDWLLQARMRGVPLHAAASA
jgi:hypothetical protein